MSAFSAAGYTVADIHYIKLGDAINMYCPVCGAEYESGITRCPDHDTELVERLDPNASPHDLSEARFVPLHNLGSPAEAEMVNDVLVQNGIRSVVQSGGADAFAPLLSATAPGAIVLVDERDFDRAGEIYNAFFGSDTTPLTGTTLDEDAAVITDDAEGQADHR